MAAIGNLNPTIVDLATREHDNKIQTIAEILSQQNEILLDGTFVEANDGSGHKCTVRTGLPQGTWRKLNYGVQPSKSTTAQIRDACGMLEDYSKIDKSLVDLASNPNEFRLSEDMAFMEGLNQTFAETLFYGNTDINPERFMGLAPRYNSLSGANVSDNVLDGGSNDTDNTSIWLVCWSPQTVHFIYPKNSKVGLYHRDLGEDTVSDGNGGEYQAMRSHFKFDVGLSVRDWRYAVRIANIEVSDLTKDAATGADLIDLMSQATELIPNLGMGRPVFYCNRTISSFLRRQVNNKSNLHLTREDYAGKKVTMFDGIPVRRCDALINTETAVS